jgi:hypothetical protein
MLPLNKALVTMYAAEATVLRDVTLPLFEGYAERHGYNVEIASAVAGLPPAWGKVAALRDALARYDLVVWVDADAAVLDPGEDVADCIPQHAFQAIAVEPRSGWCTWLWALRSDPNAHAFLAAVWDLRRDHTDWSDCEGANGRWEQAAVTHLLARDGCAGTAALGPEWDAYSASLANCRPRLLHASYQAGSYADRAAVLRRASHGTARRSGSLAPVCAGEGR